MADLLTDLTGAATAVGGVMALFGAQRPASFRGVPFGVLAGQQQIGRRQAVHEYPNRDDPWAEDLGRATRRIALTGFLVENSAVYGGGNVDAQRQRMEAAAEAKGPGILVHPSKGSISVSLLDLSIAERWNEGRYYELQFNFIVGGQRLYPSAATSTVDAVGGAATSAIAAIGAAFSTGIAIANAVGATSVSSALNTASSFGFKAGALAVDATSAFNSVSQLPGDFGRFFNGGNAGAFGSSLTSGATPVSGLLSLGSNVRAAVATASGGLLAATASLGAPNSAANVAAAAQTLAASVRASAANPSDALKLCTQLAGGGL